MLYNSHVEKYFLILKNIFCKKTKVETKKKIGYNNFQEIRK